MLNRPGYQTTAAIVAEIEDTSAWKPGKDRNGRDLSSSYGTEPLYTLQLSNCDRSISFMLEFGSPERHANNLHKLDTMISALEKFRTGLAQEHEAYECRAEEQGWDADD